MTDNNLKNKNTDNVRYVVVTPENLHDAGNHNDEIDLRELWSVIWHGKWFILAVTTVFVIASIFYALRVSNVYKSEALLAPASSEEQSGLGALSGQFGGLASLAGINLGGRNGDKTSLAIEILNSRKFISSFIEKHDILPDLMVAIGWDAITNKVEYDRQRYLSGSNKWINNVDSSESYAPSMQKAYREIRALLGVAVNKETGMVTISFEHFSPYVAKQWVDWIIQDINKVMKDREKDEAERSILYLKTQIDKTTIFEHKTLLFQLIEEQAKTLMFAEVRDEYVFKTIDSAIVPEERIKPKRAMIVIFAFLLGGLISVVVLLVRHFSKKN